MLSVPQANCDMHALLVASTANSGVPTTSPPPPVPGADIIHIIPQHICWNQRPWAEQNGLSWDEMNALRYPYTRAEAVQACLDAGCAGMAKSSWLTSGAYRFAKLDEPNDQINGMCVAAWYERDHVPRPDTDRPLYYMNVANQNCGGKVGYVYWNSSPGGAAACYGCPAGMHLCPLPPPSPPPPPPPPLPHTVFQPKQCVTTADGENRCIQIEEGHSLDDERVQAMIGRHYGSKVPPPDRTPQPPLPVG